MKYAIPANIIPVNHPLRTGNIHMAQKLVNREKKEMGYESVMINCNPETVSTDF